MRLKTIREQLLFAAHFHHQKAKKSLEVWQNTSMWPNKSFGREARRDYAIHRKLSEALDEALKLL